MGGMNLGGIIMPWTNTDAEGKHTWKAKGLGILDPFKLTDVSKDKGGDTTDAIEKDVVDIEAQAAQAEALAREKAKDEARLKIAKQTRTIFTSGLGILGTDTTKQKSTLGSN